MAEVSDTRGRPFDIKGRTMQAAAGYTAAACFIGIEKQSALGLMTAGLVDCEPLALFLPRFSEQIVQHDRQPHTSLIQPVPRHGQVSVEICIR
jgi:hypothetical protein